jgi:tetratricopeptide (TPR) repeat protein
MDNNEEMNNRLMLYLDGELAGEERTAFEKLLANDTALQTEMENLSVARLAIEHFGLTSQVANVHQTMMQELKASREKSGGAVVYPLIRNFMRIAAVLLIAVIAFGGYEFASVSPQGIYKDKYITYSTSVERGSTAVSPIEQAFADKDYKKTIGLYKSIKSPTVDDHFIAAQAYLAAGKAPEAIKAFNTVIATKPGSYANIDDTEYYLALSYLANGQPIKAEPIFERIYHNSSHLYHSKVSYWTMLRLKLLILKDPGN